MSERLTYAQLAEAFDRIDSLVDIMERATRPIRTRHLADDVIRTMRPKLRKGLAFGDIDAVGLHDAAWEGLIDAVQHELRIEVRRTYYGFRATRDGVAIHVQWDPMMFRFVVS